MFEQLGIWMSENCPEFAKMELTSAIHRSHFSKLELPSRPEWVFSFQRAGSEVPCSKMSANRLREVQCTGRKLAKLAVFPNLPNFGRLILGCMWTRFNPWCESSWTARLRQRERSVKIKLKIKSIRS